MQQFRLDVRTLLIVFTFIRFAQAISMFHVWNTHKKYPPAKKWAIGSFMAAMGVLLIGFRDMVHPLISVVLANMFAISGWAVFDFGIIRAAGKKPPFIIGSVIIAIDIAIIFWFSIIEQNYHYRVLVFSTVTIIFDAITIHACLKNPEYYNKTTFHILVASLIVMILSSLLRSASVFKQGQSSILSPDFVQAQFFVILIIFSSIITVMLVLLTTQKLQAEINEITRELILQREIERDYEKKNAITDPLTDLYNRRYFDDSLDTEFYRLRRSGAPLSLIMLDIDHFKQFNDTYGHLEGDICLKKVAAVIKSTAARAYDITARFGGEEFSIVLPETDNYTAIQIAEKIRLSVERLNIPHSESDHSDHVTLSAGVATAYTAAIPSPDSLIALADKALYSAKKNGRNCTKTSNLEITDPASRPEIDSTFLQLIWHPGNESGNSLIDLQHKQLFESANRLFVAFIDARPKDECIEILDKLLEEIRVHFHDEEHIIRETPFPSTDEHIRKHHELINDTVELAAKFKQDILPPRELFSFLAYEVIARHIFIEDKKFFPYLNINAKLPDGLNTAV